MNRLNLEQCIASDLFADLTNGFTASRHCEYPTFLNANRFLSSLALLFDCFIAILNITDFSVVSKMGFQVMFMFKPSVK